MKLIIVMALLATSLTGFAQDSEKNDVNKALKKMTYDLTLTVYQQDLVLPILEAQMELQKDSQKNPDHLQENIVKMKALNKKLDEILTPEQKEARKTTH